MYSLGKPGDIFYVENIIVIEPNHYRERKLHDIAFKTE